MTRYRGHYLSVASRREVLRIYRDRRTHWLPLTDGPLAPLPAMQATVSYFSGWLAESVAFGFPNDIQACADQYRAAQFYMDRMYNRPTAFKWRPVPTFATERALKLLANMADAS